MRFFPFARGLRAGALALGLAAAGCLGKPRLQQEKTMPTAPGSPVPIRLSMTKAHDLEVSPLGPNAWELRTTGNDPYILTEPFPEPVNAGNHPVLAFEYFCPSGIDSFQVFLGPEFSERRSVRLPGLGIAEGWVVQSYDLGRSPAWKGRIPWIRLDFGRHAGRAIRIRNLVLRDYTARERETRADFARKEAEKKRRAAALEKYVAAEFPCRIQRVAVTPDHVSVTWDLHGHSRSEVRLCEVPIWQNVLDVRRFVFATRLPDGRNTLTLPRFSDCGGARHDRLLSAWVLAAPPAGRSKRPRLLSHAHYTDDDSIAGQRRLPLPQPHSRKGLGGFDPARCRNGADADALGIGFVTVNIVLSFMRPAPGPDTLAFSYCGRTYYAAKPMIAHYDRIMRFCAKRGLVVSAIILIPNPHGFAGGLGREFVYPEYDSHGIFAMPNLTTAEAAGYYAAALQFLAERYSREDERCGRIHYWIMHNEVDAGWVWTNAGRQPLYAYLDLLHRSMRMGHLIARQYDPNARAFLSLTHHWTRTEDSHFYLPKTMLTAFARWARAEGDFEWGLAYHPYPESLFNPRSWEDKDAVYSFDTPLITFKNIEVLAAWMEQPAMKYHGRKLRKVHLSEQGPNSPDYSEKSLRDQAAAMAYVWKKIEALPVIEAFDYHNWIDNPHEGGLRLGLRMFPGKEFHCKRKPVWFVYQNLGTPQEDAACAFALRVIGVPDWAAVRRSGPLH